MNNTDIYVNMDSSFLSLSAIPTAAKSLHLWGGHRMETLWGGHRKETPASSKQVIDEPPY